MRYQMERGNGTNMCVVVVVASTSINDEDFWTAGKAGGAGDVISCIRTLMVEHLTEKPYFC